MNKCFFTLLLFFIFNNHIIAKDNRVIIKYKQYEKFDFDSLSLRSDDDIPDDFTLSKRFQNDFKNPLPVKKSFHREMIDNIDSIF